MLRACVVVVVILLSLIATPLSAACDEPKVFDLPFREIALDLAPHGNELWVATSHGLALWSRSSPPLRLGAVAVPGPTVTVVAVAGGAWAGSGSALHYIDRATMRIEASIEIASPVNDLAEQGGFLYAATPRGIVQVDALDPANPVEVRTLKTTATGGALSLALLGQTLYAAEGTRAFDAFTLNIPTLPQKIATIETSVRTTSIRAAGSYLIASDGQQSDVFTGTGGSLTRSAIVPFGGRSATPSSGSVVYLAGSDRRIRAVDVLASPPAVLASLDVPITEGSVNRVGALELLSGDVWVAAGDAGVLAWDATALRAPYPLRSIAAGAVTSGWIANDRIVVAPASGGLQRYADSSGQIVAGPSWETASAWTVHDGDGLRVLASSGARLAMFDAGAAAPASLGSITLGAAVRSAVLTGPSRAIAVLADGSVFTVDFAANPPAAAQSQVPGMPQFIAAGGAAIAMAEIRSDGKTVVRYWASGDLASAPLETTLEGASNGGIAVAPGVVAAATFEGLVLVGFGETDGIRVVPGTNFAPVRDLHIEGDRIFMVTANRVDVRALSDGSLASSWIPGGEAGAIQASSSSKAVVATSSGFDVIDLATSSTMPVPIDVPGGENRYYASMEGDGGLIWLAELGSIDAYRISGSGTPRFAGSIALADPVLAFAAIGDRAYTIGAGGRITGFSANGAEVASLQIDEAPDQEVIGLDAAGGALWVSLRVGCLTTGCAGRTVIVDARTGALVRTASIDGAAVDVTADGDRAAAVFTLPAELRTYAIGDPAHPSLLLSQGIEGNPVSVEIADGVVWTLGDRLRSWVESSLSPRSVELDPYVADPAGRVSYLDQEVHVLGTCLFVVGREPQPRRFTLTGGSLAEAAPIEASGAMREFAPTDSGFILLGETSLEAWSSAPPPTRRRAVRR